MNTIVIPLIIFFALGFGFFITKNREVNMKNTMDSISMNQVDSIEFYKDPIRDSEGLNLSIIKPDDKNEFLQALTKLKPSKKHIKSFRILETTKVSLIWKTEKSTKLMIKIYKTKELENIGLVSISEIGSIIEYPAGIYESELLLDWLEKIVQRKEFQNM